MDRLSELFNRGDLRLSFSIPCPLHTISTSYLLRLDTISTPYLLDSNDHTIASEWTSIRKVSEDRKCFRRKLIKSSLRGMGKYGTLSSTTSPLSSIATNGCLYTRLLFKKFKNDK